MEVSTKKRNNLDIQSFPDEIKLEIFSRLPAESIVECKRVCTQWRNLISNVSFSDMHLREYLRRLDKDDDDRVRMVLLVCRHQEDKVLYHVVYDHNDEESTLTLSKINHPSIDLGCRLIGSCNGLICFVQLNGNYWIEDPIYIYNPITREFLNLPRFDPIHLSPEEVKKDPVLIMFCGFGYQRSANLYKVVRICYLKDQQSLGRVQVYTLGSGSGWKNIGEIKYNLQLNVHDNSGILVDGALHWVSDGYTIVRFDLAAEEFCLLPSPPCILVDENNTFVLKELGGSLCVVHKKKGEFLEVWSLEKMKMSGCFDFKGQEYRSGSWNKTITIKVDSDDDDDDDDDDEDDYDPFAVIKGPKVLMWYNETVLYTFDLKTQSFTEIDLQDKGTDFCSVIHMNSFVSLKSLGEDAKIIGSVDEAESCILL